MDLAEKKREHRHCRVSPGCPPVPNQEPRKAAAPAAPWTALAGCVVPALRPPRAAPSSSPGTPPPRAPVPAPGPPTPATHIQVPPLNSKAEGGAGGTRSRNLSGAARAHPSALGPGPSRAPLPLARLTPKQVSLQPQLAAFCATMALGGGGGWKVSLLALPRRLPARKPDRVEVARSPHSPCPVSACSWGARGDSPPASNSAHPPP